MGQSIILVASATEEIKKFIDKQKAELIIKSFVDCYEINPPHSATIGIESARDLKAWVATKPYASTHKIGIIYQAEGLTEEAQNSLLKTLEEPPLSTTIVLVTKNENLLLPTILSRCLVYKLSVAEIKERFTFLWTELNLAKKLTVCEEIVTAKDITRAKSLFSKLLEDYRLQLLATSAKITESKLLQQIKFIDRSNFMLDNGGSLKLILENLVFYLS